jgi:hypothetical protein
MRRLMPGAVQIVYDNYNGLVVGFGPTERPSHAVVSILLTPDHLTLCFIDDAPSLPDPEKLLKGSGNVVRHIRLPLARDLDRPAICALVAEAVKRADVPFDPRQRATGDQVDLEEAAAEAADARSPPADCEELMAGPGARREELMACDPPYGSLP